MHFMENTFHGNYQEIRKKVLVRKKTWNPWTLQTVVYHGSVTVKHILKLSES